MRKDMVDQKDGQARLTVKLHMDDFKRVTVREQEYFYYNVSNTPFSLAIAWPSKYGKYRVSGGLDWKSYVNGKNVTKVFPKISEEFYKIYSSFRNIPRQQMETPPWLELLRWN